MAVRQDLGDMVAEFKLFADLTPSQLQAATHIFDELWFTEGQRILRKGFSQPDMFVIVDGEAEVKIKDYRAKLMRGDFFGEISVLLGEPPSADVVALGPLRCLQLPGSEVERFMHDHPTVMYRTLQALARRLRNANRWRS